MVQMNLFSGKEQKHRCKEQTCGHGEGGRNCKTGIGDFTFCCCLVAKSCPTLL